MRNTTLTFDPAMTLAIHSMHVQLVSSIPSNPQTLPGYRLVDTCILSCVFQEYFTK